MATFSYNLVEIREDFLADVFYYKKILARQGGSIIATRKDGSTCNLYSPFICALLALNQVEGYNLLTDQVEIIDGNIFNEEYFKGHDDGFKALETEYGITLDKLTSPGFEVLIENLHRLYYDGSQGEKSWVTRINIAQLIINNKNVYEYGYFAGLMDRTNWFAKRLPIQFENFHTVDFATDSPGKPSQRHEENPKKTEGESQPSPAMPLTPSVETPLGIIYIPEPINTPPKSVRVKIHIREDYRQELFSELKPNIDEEQHEDLKKLILINQQIESVLVFQGSGADLGMIFRGSIRRGGITSFATVVADWLIENFRTQKGKYPDPAMTYETAYKYLTSK